MGSGQSTEVDVVVIGAGLAGAATAWSAARRGLSVLVCEQFGPGHAQGSSHGSARIVRRAYSDALYVRLTGPAFELWREIEQASGTTLLRMLGGLDFGQRRDVPAVAALLTEAGVAHEVLDAVEAGRRWPGMVFDGPVVHHAQAGTMDAAGSVTALLALAAGHGAQVRHDTAVTALHSAGDGVRVVTADGAEHRAGTAVVAAGAWLPSVVDGLIALPPLTVTQQQVFHFPRLDPAVPPWPSVIHEPNGHAVYHLAGGRDGGPGDDRKIGEHDGGSVTTPDTRDGVIDPTSRTRVIEYVRRWLPGLDPTPRAEASCLYTETASEDFLIDRVGPIVVCSPCSGHGAKFAPVIGELVADLLTGRDQTHPDRFRLAAHADGRPGAGVSL